MQDPEREQLTRRVAELERSNRRWKRLSVGLAAALALLLAGGLAAVQRQRVLVEREHALAARAEADAQRHQAERQRQLAEEQLRKAEEAEGAARGRQR